MSHPFRKSAYVAASGKTRSSISSPSSPLALKNSHRPLQYNTFSQDSASSGISFLLRRKAKHTHTHSHIQMLWGVGHAGSDRHGVPVTFPPVVKLQVLNWLLGACEDGFESLQGSFGAVLHIQPVEHLDDITVKSEQPGGKHAVADHSPHRFYSEKTSKRTDFSWALKIQESPLVIF